MDLHLRNRIREHALSLGFDLVGFTTADALVQDAEEARRRVRDGLLDGMPWFNEARVARGAEPRRLLRGARSVIALAMNYRDVEGEVPLAPALADSPSRPRGAIPSPLPSRLGAGSPPLSPSPLAESLPLTPSPPGRGIKGEGVPRGPGGEVAGRVARYAWGRDYHNLLRQRMKALAHALPAIVGRPVRSHWYVDDGPLLDRAVARRAGILWQGKNTLVMSSRLGSYLFVGAVVTDLELQPDAPLRKSCGSCVRCLVACPTGAFIAPYVLDARRCISYLTIEHRGPIPWGLRPLMGDWVFGCDVCQEVCPVNLRPAATREAGFQQRRAASMDLLALLEMTEAGFRERYEGSPVRRAGLERMQRNACVALGNAASRSERAVAALSRALQGSPWPVVRGHAAWALGRLGGEGAKDALLDALRTETDAGVLEEVRLAAKRCAGFPDGGRCVGTHTNCAW